MIKRVILFVFLIIFSQGFFQTVDAGFREGVRAYRSKNYDTAREELTPLAKRGNAKAQYVLGLMHLNGRGVDEDEDKATEWFLKAEKGLHVLANKGKRDSQFFLGWMHYKGLGVAKNLKEAAKWFGKSAENGYKSAQFRIGHMYHYGLGVPWDENKAIEWYEKAAIKDNAFGALRIGAIYAQEGLVPRDDIKAVMWYHVAIALAKRNMRRYRRAGVLATQNLEAKRFSVDMFQDDIDKAKKMAKKWLSKYEF